MSTTEAGDAAVAERRRPRFELEQEIRFAVVMYGGVSLAIYINGVAQELFRLVRATAPELPHPEAALDGDGETQRVYLPDAPDATDRPATSGTERIYRELGQILSAGEPPREAAAPGDPVRTRFVVDILSGTSAGGINAIFLASAIANQQDFSVSSDLWLSVADIDELLQGKESFADLPPDTPRNAQSLLNGHRLYWKAREAMRAMAESRQESPDDPWRPAYAEQLDLAVTATDLAGVASQIRLTADRTATERSHQTVFRFSYGTEQTTGETHSDFIDLDLMLGMAARATSSFPFAFEPVRLADLRPLDAAEYDATDLARFFAVHRRMVPAFDLVDFGDGGYLDNKPGTYATEAPRRRRADVPVRRQLVYIEPHPMAEPVAAPEHAERPDVFASIAASIALPRHETIRADIATVAERNGAVARLRELGLYAEQALAGADPLAALPGQDAAGSDAATDELLGPVGPSYAAYRSLRVRTVLDELAARAAELRDDADTITVRAALRDWVETRHATDLGSFLAAYDAAYQQRRLSFLHDRINELLRGGARAAEMRRLVEGGAAADATGDPGARAGELRALKLQLNEAVDGLRRAERAPRAHDLAAVLSESQRERFEAVRRHAGALPSDVDAYMDAVAAFLAGPLAEADRGIRTALATLQVSPWMRDLLEAYNHRFQAFDMMVLPLAYPDLGEVNAVDILRISPLDAPSIRPLSVRDDPTAKLAGVRVRHFGGFLDRSWRENDLMWGRLDAAEAIIDALLREAPEAQRRSLRERAHAAILREALADPLRHALEPQLGVAPGATADHELVEAFRAQYMAPGDLDVRARERLASRSVAIAGQVLGRGAKGRRLPAWPFALARRIGPTLVRIALRIRSRKHVPTA